jgi:hypothetical protein
MTRWLSWRGNYTKKGSGIKLRSPSAHEAQPLDIPKITETYSLDTPAGGMDDQQSGQNIMDIDRNRPRENKISSNEILYGFEICNEGLLTDENDARDEDKIGVDCWN